MVEPSAETARSRVQWPPPSGKPTIFSGGPELTMSPDLYGIAIHLAGRRDIDEFRLGTGRIEGYAVGPVETCGEHADIGGASPRRRRACTSTRPAPLSARNTSPLGAVRMTRGSLRFLVMTSTAKPNGALGSTPCGRADLAAAALDDGGVALGGGKSAGVMRNRRPGVSMRQSANAAGPVKVRTKSPRARPTAAYRRRRRQTRDQPPTHTTLRVDVPLP